MVRSWIVTANSGCASVYLQKSPSAPLEPLTQMRNAEASSVTSETESDKLGQHAASNSRHGVGAPTQPSGYEPNQTPAQHHAEVFARRLVDFLKKGYNANSFEKLYLFAAPEFLGVLRHLLDSNLNSLIVLQVDKDYTKVTTAQLRELIAAQVAA
ncbi:MAG TPA: host attachment protein [Cellvibrio sp.]|nr:host attachment protein [Cellvibrio sp.]